MHHLLVRVFIFFLSFGSSIHAGMLDKYADTDYLPEIENRINHLIEKIDQSPGEPWLLFLDIDETMISNLQWLSSERNFKVSLEEFDKYVIQERGEAISSVLRLYHIALSRGYPVIVATGRIPQQRPMTLAVLKKAGYEKIDKVFFKPEDKPVEQFKSKVRCEFADRGFAVINVGDQLSDMLGGCATISLKLPNPFYKTGYMFSEI